MDKCIQLIDKLGTKVDRILKKIIVFGLNILKKEEKLKKIKIKYYELKEKINIIRIMGICTISISLILVISISKSFLNKDYRGVVDDVITGMIECDSTKILNNVPDEINTGLKKEYTRSNGYSDNFENRMIEEMNYDLKQEINEEVNWEYGYKWKYSYEIKEVIDYDENQIANYLKNSEFTSNFDKIKNVQVIVTFKNEGKQLGTQEMYLKLGYRDGRWYYLVL